MPLPIFFFYRLSSFYECHKHMPFEDHYRSFSKKWISVRHSAYYCAYIPYFTNEQKKNYIFVIKGYTIRCGDESSKVFCCPRLLPCVVVWFCVCGYVCVYGAIKWHKRIASRKVFILYSFYNSFHLFTDAHMGVLTNDVYASLLSLANNLSLTFLSSRLYYTNFIHYF